MLPPLTAKQRAVFDFVAACIADDGRAPTMREIGDAFDIKSPNGVVAHLTLIARKGYLDFGRDGSSRHLGVPGLAEHLAPFAREYLAKFAPAAEAAVPA